MKDSSAGLDYAGTTGVLLQHDWMLENTAVEFRQYSIHRGSLGKNQQVLICSWSAPSCRR